MCTVSIEAVAMAHKAMCATVTLERCREDLTVPLVPTEGGGISARYPCHKSSPLGGQQHPVSQRSLSYTRFKLMLNSWGIAHQYPARHVPPTTASLRQGYFVQQHPWFSNVAKDVTLWLLQCFIRNLCGTNIRDLNSSRNSSAFEIAPKKITARKHCPTCRCILYKHNSASDSSRSDLCCLSLTLRICRRKKYTTLITVFVFSKPCGSQTLKRIFRQSEALYKCMMSLSRQSCSTHTHFLLYHVSYFVTSEKGQFCAFFGYAFELTF